MTAKLKSREAGTLQVRRIVCAQIAAALSALESKRVTDSAIHEARKSIKKARALWRLLQPALSAGSYQHVDTRLRDAGRPLGAARDAKILVSALDAVLKHASGGTAARSVSVFRRGLIQDQSAIRQAVVRGPSGIASSRRLLRRSRKYIESLSIGKHGWAVLGKGLQRVYAGGRRMYHRASADPRAQDLHEWRKQVQYLHHQLAILKPLWKGPIGELAAETADLSERLGEDHDLTVLRARMRAQHTLFASRAQRGRIAAAIIRQRTALQDKAFKLGARIYAEKPRDFSARFGGYWHGWRHPGKCS